MKTRKGKDCRPALTMDDLAAYPFPCANCSITFEEVKLFCGPLCNEEASWVRYVRRCHADGRDRDVKVAEAITIRLAHILGGGYDKAARRLPESVRRFVMERDGERCQICGGPGVEIDHIRGSNSDQSNLQLLCDACHNKKTVASFKRITKESHLEEWAKAQWLRKRAAASEPLLLCDSESWDSIQKELMRTRRDVVTGQGGLFG
jgi:hypothetical protein